MTKQELQDKTEKMRRGLNNPAIQGDARTALEKALENAEKQLAQMEPKAVEEPSREIPRIGVYRLEPNVGTETIEEMKPLESPKAAAETPTEKQPSVCNVTRNLKQNGIEIKFPKPPSDEMISRIKAKGFRWSKFQKIWYVRYSESLHQFAIDICGETEHSDNPASMPMPSADPKARLITLAVLTTRGKVPQGILRDEIRAGKLEMARYKKFNGMTDSTDYYSADELAWEDASLDADNYDIERLKKNGANTHYTDSIYLDDEGTITYGDYKFRYKTTVKGHDYSPKAERDKIQETKQLEANIQKQAAARVVDLDEQKYHVPFNRPVQKGSFVISDEERLNADEFIGLGEMPGVVEIDGYRLVGTMEAQNLVTSIMVTLGGGNRTENRENLWVFKPEAGTALPGYLSRWSRYRKLREGDKSDFPGWRLQSFPTSVWESLRNQAREAISERQKMNEPKKTERGRKIHEGKMNEALTRVKIIKKVWVEYEAANPGRLIQVTGQDQGEYDEMIALWRSKDLGMNEIPAQVVPKAETRQGKSITVWMAGKKRPITLPNGEKHEAMYAIVELDSILASHNEETFADTEGYPRNTLGGNLNDRNYATDRGAQQLVEEYAHNLNPELVISLTSTPEGTPIITPKGIVVSGNNRTMSLKLARKKYDAKWREYQAALQNELDVFGFDKNTPDQLAKMNAPVLVRIDYDFGELTTTNMAKYNASAMKAKSPVDRAAELATTLREQILCETNIPQIIGQFDTLTEFYAHSGAIKRMVTAMQQCSVLNEQDMPAYLDGGYFTEDGKTLLETILASLILEPDTLRIANRDGVRSFRQAVVNALPVLIANKNLDASATLIPTINKAIRYQGEVVASGLGWENFVNQVSMFSDERADCNTVYINRLMNEGQRIFREAIRKYNDSQAQAGSASLFAADVVTPQEAFEGYIMARLPKDTVSRIQKYCGTAAAKVEKPEVIKPAFAKDETAVINDPVNTELNGKTVKIIRINASGKAVWYEAEVTENGRTVNVNEAALKKPVENSTDKEQLVKTAFGGDVRGPLTSTDDKKQLAQTRLKLLEKALNRLEGDKKSIAQTRIKLLTKFIQK